MKHKVEIKPKEFNPISVTFTLENKRELEFFLSYFNASGNNQILFANTNRLPSVADDFDTSAFNSFHVEWKKLENLLQSL
jgi:hypothetical protein